MSDAIRFEDLTDIEQNEEGKRECGTLKCPKGIACGNAYWCADHDVCARDAKPAA